MRTFLWLCIGLAAGLAISFAVQRILSNPDSPADVVEDDADADATVGAARAPRRAPALVITDVYTTDEAAQAALDEREAIDRVVDAILSSEPRRPESGITTSGTIAGLFESSAAADMAVEETATEAIDPYTAALEQEVVSVVEGFLRDAIESRNVQAYLTALDEDFRYTADGGTPADTADDVVFDGDEYREMAASQLFEGYPIADVTLSPPYELVVQGADMATVQYDYEMSLRGPEGSRDLAGAASFLLMRGGTRGDTDAWRIVDWVDSPPRSRERADEER